MTQRPTACEHAETTTLLWLYGEGPEDHAQHVATCEICAEVARTHADVAAAVLPLADHLGEPLPGVLAEPEPLPAPANSGWWIGVVGGLVAAAAVLLALFGAFGLPGSSSTPAPVPVAEVVPETPAPDPLPGGDAPFELALDEAPEPLPEAPLEQVDADLLARTPAPAAVSPEDERLAEALLDQAFSSEVDDDLQALFDEFEALEADLTTL